MENESRDMNMGKQDRVVDYLDLVARAAVEDRVGRDQKSVLPEPAGEQMVDYLAVSKAWKENRGWMDNEENKTKGDQ